MKRVISALVAILFLVSMPSFAINSKEISSSVEISKPDIIEKENYLRIEIEESEYFINPGKPIVPKIIKVFEIPFGAKNIKIDVFPKEISEINPGKELAISPYPTILSANEILPTNKKYEHEDTDYEIYPSSWYSYRIGCGLNDKMERVTFVTVHLFPVRYKPSESKIYFASNFEIKIRYDKPSKLTSSSSYDLVIISPKEFAEELNKLVEHKNSHGVRTFLKTTDEIYSSYPGRDKPEQIKYFIKDAIENYGIKYVMLVGGVKSIIYSKPRDHANYGEKGWYLPVRYSNLIADEPGYLCDLYYADIYRAGGEFDDWDSNGNGIFAEWSDVEGEPEDMLDLYPDVAVGRLACTSLKELKTVIEKIINYENNPFDEFKRILVVSGDGFLDQKDLDIRWDTKRLPNGKYTIYAQSMNAEGELGPIDKIEITIDKTKKTSLHFNHDDHLNPALKNGYPAPPIAEIVSVSNGDVLGKDDYVYVPSESEAYCNELFWWANVTYIDGVLYIRGKSYDPKPYGNLTSIHVWVENENGSVVFEDWRNNTEMYYEGEWVTGEKILNGRGGALYYMPKDFEREILWTSNGKFRSMEDVINGIGQGCGFAFLSGHGSPGFWGDHLPGIPGNRRNSQLAGLVVSQVRPYFPFFELPFFPMEKLSNNNKLPVVVVGGCHNSMFNVSSIPTVFDIFLLLLFGKNIWMHTYGQLVPECWSWYIVKLPERGAIASIGNTGYGWGWEGEFCTVGAGDGWITSEFFRQYGEKRYEILGANYVQTLNSYISHFKEFTLPECWWSPDAGWDWIDEKTVQQWVLLGDPSLKLGGY